MTVIKLPPLPNPVCYYWTPKQESGLPAKLSSWSTNTGPHPDWDVGRYFNEDELRARDLEVARVVLEAAAQRLEIQADNIDSLSDPNSWDASASSVRQSICYILAMKASHNN